MPIRIECSSCQKVIQAKDEFAGRRVKCPGCQEVLTLPDLEPEDDVDLEVELPPPRPARSLPAAKKKGPRSRSSSSSGKPWYLRHWHWLVALTVLLLAPIPKVGLVLAGLVSLAGAAMALIGGVVPLLRIIFGDPGTVLTMLVSRSARFDMMRQPDSHPYKVLVRNAFNPTRGLFWRGVLFLFTFVPAAFISGLSGEFFRARAAAAPPPAAPHWMPHGAARVHRPEFQHPGQQPQQNQQQREPGARPPFQPPFPTSGQTTSSGRSQVEVVFDRFQGAGTPTEAAQRALESFSALLPGTLEVDEAAKTIRFQTKGPVNPSLFGQRLGRAGFGSIQLTSRSVPEN